MCSLDKTQVLLIEEDVRQASITLSHLSDDLIDHICCEVEVLMEEGQVFFKAYERVKKQTGISVLKKIQDDTQFLIDKNYRLMKTSMKIIGNISLALIMFGTVFKIMHWPGASVFLTGGFAFICALFFPMAIYVNYKKVSQQKNLALHLVMLFSGLIFMIGVIFKIQHWPFGSVMLFTGYISLITIALPIFLINMVRNAASKKDKWMYALGIISLIIFATSSMFKLFHWPGAAVLMLVGAFLLISVFLPMYTWRRIQMEGKITGQFIYTIIVAMFLVMFTSLTALNVSKDYLSNFIEHGSNERSISQYLENKNNLLFAELDQKEDSLINKIELRNIHQQADEICVFVKEIQLDMIRLEEANNAHTPEILLDRPELILNKDKSDQLYMLMIAPENNGKAFQLKEKLSKFQTSLIALSEVNRTSINGLFDLAEHKKWDRVVTWEHYYFYGTVLVDALATLDEIQAKVRTAESVAIRNISQSINS